MCIYLWTDKQVTIILVALVIIQITFNEIHLAKKRNSEDNRHSTLLLPH